MEDEHSLTIILELDGKKLGHVLNRALRMSNLLKEKKVKESMSTDIEQMVDRIYIDRELPPALVKALHDSFDYALGLRNGQVIHFYEAHLSESGKWVQLIGFGDEYSHSIEMSGVDYTFPRGLYVRLSDIMWVADAPNGS
jgi:hypothetical protein